MAVNYKRNREKLNDQEVFLSSNTSFHEKTEFIDITGPIWNIFFISINSGSFNWLTKQGVIKPHSKKFGLYLPSYSLAIDLFDNTNLDLKGIYSTKSPPINENRPFIFDLEKEPLNKEELLNGLLSSKIKTFVDYNSSPEDKTLEIKNDIDLNFKEIEKISQIAEKFKLNQATVSRKFKDSFYIGPKQYLNLLKIVYGEYLLGLGKDINDVIFEVGFQDFSRFYKQFKGKFNDTPNTFKKNDFE
jgi:AraC-like DNA-binding protein